MAIVLKVSDKFASVGLSSGEEGTIPLSELKWARKALPLRIPEGDVKVPILHVGPEIQHPSDVLNVGDVILVSAVKDKENTYSLEQKPIVSGALMAMDPHTGRILAMSGGFSFEGSQFNRATQALRQPGSAIKPFVYLAAMERGFSPATIVSDSSISIAMGRGLGTYAPKNVTTNYYGRVPLRIGLQKSLNRMTIRLVHQYVGMKPVARMIEKFGIMDHVPMQIAMSLGAGETTLLKLITAYAMIANGGKRLEPTLIDRVQDRHGKTIFSADRRVCTSCQDQGWSGQEPPIIEDHREQLADPRSVYQITSMLEGAVRSGSARRAQVIGKILAGKTGTTNDERDAWMFLYTPDLVVGAYIGYDKPQSLGHMEGGSRVALPVVVDFTGKALEGIPSKPFKVPPGMKLIRMKEMSGQPAQSGDAGVIYEALKDDQNLQGRSFSSERTDYSPDDALQSQEHEYEAPNEYERESAEYYEVPERQGYEIPQHYNNNMPPHAMPVGMPPPPSDDSQMPGMGGLY